MKAYSAKITHRGDTRSSTPKAIVSTVAILQKFQKETDRPNERMKRSAAQSLVRRGDLEWVIRNVLARRCNPKPISTEERKRIAQKMSDDNYRRALISLPMPPAEVSGCHFEDPVRHPNMPRVLFFSRAEREQQLI